ncbi:hypothetical protein sS8_1653 [Methylocaldum marinum]|uniref:Uncharacterized protein n=1 Tax=Methylocaldum marinum TaxID=1432792 RepID=A0A250KPK6_9GAMM|nr:hypothetical protein [Methylocaldum marinum]BBA33610.1 hypothetical protein sS8_1653 [Methylocaldum marinum]
MNKVWVFQESTLETALDEWVRDQIDHYPQKEELIRTVALAMRDFLNSRQVAEHKMVMKVADKPRF